VAAQLLLWSYYVLSGADRGREEIIEVILIDGGSNTGRTAVRIVLWKIIRRNVEL
jgi:hypothetical protein